MDTLCYHCGQQLSNQLYTMVIKTVGNLFTVIYQDNAQADQAVQQKNWEKVLTDLPSEIGQEAPSPQLKALYKKTMTAYLETVLNKKDVTSVAATRFFLDTFIKKMMAHPTLQARVGTAPSFFADNSYASQKMVVTDVLRDTLHQIAEDMGMHPQLDPLNMYDHVSVRMQKSFLRGGEPDARSRSGPSVRSRSGPSLRSTSARDDARSLRSVRSGYSRRSVQKAQAPDARELAVREARPEADGSRAEWPNQPEAHLPRPPPDARRSQHVPKDQPKDQPPAHKSVRLGDGGSRLHAPKAFKSSKSRTCSVHPRPPRHDKPSGRSLFK